MNHDKIKLDMIEFDYDGESVVGDYTVTIARDEFPENPRTAFDQLGRMVCWHNHYSLGDEHGYETPLVLMHTLSGLYSDTPAEDLTEAQRDRIHDAANEKAIILPLYLYDHSGITMRCTQFNCSWDSGQVGYIYITLAELREYYSVKRVSQKLYNRAIKGLEAEVAEYDQYLTGDVYHYNIVKNVNDEKVVIDSCGGFYGQDEYMLDEIRNVIAANIANTPQQLELV